MWSEIGGRGRASLVALAEGVPPAAAPAEKWKNAGEWLDDTKLAVCVSATEELGKFVPLSVVVDADDAQVAAMIAAVCVLELEESDFKKFKRALAEVRGKGETFA